MSEKAALTRVRQKIDQLSVVRDALRAELERFTEISRIVDEALHESGSDGETVAEVLDPPSPDEHVGPDVEIELGGLRRNYQSLLHPDVGGLIGQAQTAELSAQLNDAIDRADHLAVADVLDTVAALIPISTELGPMVVKMFALADEVDLLREALGGFADSPLAPIHDLVVDDATFDLKAFIDDLIRK